MAGQSLKTAVPGALTGLVLLSAQASWAAPKVFKVDEFDVDLTTAASEIGGSSLDVQPAWAQGEAFGQIYVPAPADYPVEIRALDIIMAAAPMGPGLTTHAMIEVYNTTSAGPDPGAGTLIFSASTQDLLDPGTSMFGVPLQGDSARRIAFDWTDPNNFDDHPPPITSGNIWVMLRWSEAASNREVEWNDAQCLQLDPILCGCQPIGTIHDTGITPTTNVMHIIDSACSGTATLWTFMETVGIPGDLILRMHTEVSSGPCTPSCGTNVCGSDGCGGNCGLCDLSETCNAGTCETTPATSCTFNSDCLNGTYCGPANTCIRDCREDIDCNAGETCSSVGRCDPVMGNPNRGGCHSLPVGPASILLVFVTTLKLRRRLSM